MTALTAHLFGPFRLSSDGRDIRPRSRKSSGLVAYLFATERHAASRARLADLLWTDRGEAQSRGSLRQSLAELRTTALADLLDVSRNEVVLDDSAIECDLDGLARAAETCDVALLLRVVGAIQGAFLDDLDGLSPGFDEWLQGERPRRHEWLLALLLDCCGRAGPRQAGEVRQLLGQIERLDPLNEEVVRMRLRADHEAGDVASIHRRYRRLVNDLSRELSVAPSAETRALFEMLIAQPAGAASPSMRPMAVPPPPPPRSEPAHAPAEPPPLPAVIAIAPFAAEGDEETQTAAAILSESVSTSLLRNSDVRVVSADPSDPARMAELRRRAMAVYAVTGSLRRFGGAISVHVQLGNAVTGMLAWSERLRLEQADLALLDGLVARIVGAVGPAIDRDLGTSLPASTDGSEPEQEAARLYARAASMVREARTMDAARDAERCFEQVLALDPRHVGARLRLAQLYNTDFNYLIAGHDALAWRRKALALVKEAAELERASIRVQLRLAWCQMRQGEWESAARLFHAAEEAMPHDPDAIDECGFGFVQIGELDKARELLQRAFRLNPFAPAEYHADFAILLALAGEHDLAEEHFEVCGEQRLFWQVLRLGNLTRLDPESQTLLALQRRFVTTFREIWVGVAPPTLEDVLDWAPLIFCFRKPEHYQLVVDGLSAAWAAFGDADAAPDSKRSSAAADRERPAAEALPAGTPVPTHPVA